MRPTIREMSPAAATIEVDLGFTPASHVIDDPDRPDLPTVFFDRYLARVAPFIQSLPHS